jgi:hypothetical protein
MKGIVGQLVRRASTEELLRGLGDKWQLVDNHFDCVKTYEVEIPMQWSGDNQLDAEIAKFVNGNVHIKVTAQIFSPDAKVPSEKDGQFKINNTYSLFINRQRHATHTESSDRIYNDIIKVSQMANADVKFFDFFEMLLDYMATKNVITAEQATELKTKPMPLNAKEV